MYLGIEIEMQLFPNLRNFNFILLYVVSFTFRMLGFWEVPKELQHVVNDVVLQHITRTSTLERCSFTDGSLIFEGTESSVKAAKDLTPVWKVMLEKKVKQVITTEIPVTGKLHTLISITDMKDIVDNGVEVSMKKKRIILNGTMEKVSNAKEMVSVYLAGLMAMFNDPDSSSRNVRGQKDSTGNETTVRKKSSKRYAERKVHPCPFCKGDLSSAYIRDHVVKHCPEAENISPEKRHNALDEYYSNLRRDSKRNRPKHRPIPDDQNSFGSNVCSQIDYLPLATGGAQIKSEVKEQSSSFPSSQPNKSIQINNDSDCSDGYCSSTVSSSSTCEKPIYVQLEQYRKWMDSRFSPLYKQKAATKNSKISTIKKIVRKLDIATSEFLCDSANKEKIVGAIESLPVSSGTKYVHTKDLILYLHFLSKFDEALSESAKKSIEDWEGARKSFQDETVDQRVVKKKLDSDRLQNGEMPTLIDASIFANYLDLFVQNLNLEHPGDNDQIEFKLKVVIVYATVYCCLFSVIRPSMIERMTVVEFQKARSLINDQGERVYVVRVIGLFTCFQYFQ